jgi:hypothetical protein
MGGDFFEPERIIQSKDREIISVQRCSLEWLAIRCCASWSGWL